MFIRLLHGFGIGGEQGNAILITFEHAPEEARGYFSSWVQIGAPAGFVLPLGLFAVLSATMSNAAFLSWGWRIPFLLSILLIAIGLYIRLQLSESPLFRRERSHEHHPLRAMLQTHRRGVLLGCGVKLLESTVFTTYAVILTAYAVSRGIPKSTMTTATLAAILIELVMLPLFGALSDRVGRRKVYMAGALLNILLAVPAFWAVYGNQPILIAAALIGVLGFGHSAMYGPQAAFFAELFPTRMRASGVSFIQQIGALIGSVGTLAAGWLLALAHGAPWILVTYLIAVGGVTLACTYLLPETAPRLSFARGVSVPLASGMEGRNRPCYKPGAGSVRTIRSNWNT